MNRQGPSMPDHPSPGSQIAPLPTEHDSPWEHVLPSQNPHLITRARLEKGGSLSKTSSFEIITRGDLHGELNRSESASPMSAYSSESTRSRGYESGGSPSTSIREWEPVRDQEAFLEAVGSNGSSPCSGTSEQDDSGGAEPEGRVVSEDRAAPVRARPFTRKSKAGNQHYVTPSSAAPSGGFVCTFMMGNSVCRQAFKLPSDIRAHLIESHITFSPFQCETCKRVYTRKSLYTRHLKDVDGTHTNDKRGPRRMCPNREIDADDAFYVRKETYAALWAIQTTQDQVDKAISTISTHNGMLPGRRRRTQNPHETESPEIGLPILGTHTQVSTQRVSPENSPPYSGSFPPSLHYTQNLPRTRGTSDYLPQRVTPPYTPSTESGSANRRSPLAGSNSYQSPATYQGPQGTPIIPQGGVRGFMGTDAGQPLYGPNSIYTREYMESLEQSDNINPNMLQHVATPHRTAWEEGRQDYPTWPVARTGGQRQQVLYPNQGFKEGDYHYQSDAQNDGSQPNVFDPATASRDLSAPDRVHKGSPKTGA
ncbi:unnamed protein product [Tuber aestivum]|uniref:C2H2-type domain-containing protein n=1 Tax=Tuber aestivum TaxID=59557 RepID=A0A292PZC3_9PEZI|nr:unnamed protein product [Tuber aestivum]